MNLIEEITKILKLILILGAIANSPKLMLAAVIAVLIYGGINLDKAKKKQN